MSTRTLHESQRRKITVALFVSQSLFSAAMIAAFTLMPIIAAQLTESDAAAGVPSTVGLVGRAAAAYPIGWLMDRVGRRLGLAAGFGFGVVGTAVSVFGIILGSFLLFCVGILLLGFGRASAEQSRYVAAEVVEPARRAKVIGLIVFAGTIGSILGPGIVDYSTGVASQIGIPENAGPFVFGFAFLLLAFLITFIFLYPDPLLLSKAFDNDAEPVQNSFVPPTTLRQIDLRAIFGKPLVQLALAAMVIGQLVMTMIMTITPLHMDHHDHATRSISFVIMAHTLGMFGLSSVTGMLIDRFGRIPMIILGALVLIMASVMAPLSTSVPLLSTALFLLGLGWNFCFIAGSSLLSDSLRPSEKGRIQGASEVLVSLGAGGGSLSTGFIFAGGGMTAVSAVGLGFALVLVAWLAYYRVVQRPEAAFG